MKTFVSIRKDAEMPDAEILEKLLREEGIYPPSGQDSQYGDKAEMTRGEIIEKTLQEMDRDWSWGQGSRFHDEAGHLSKVIAELQRRLPYGNIKTCGAFKHLNAGCCDVCHTAYPHYDIYLLDAPDGTKAWVCCAMNRAIYPERYAERIERFRNTPEGKLWQEIFGDADRRKYQRCRANPMRKDLEEKLVERWPSWINISDDPGHTLMSFGFQHGDGWFRLVWRLCERL